MQYICTTIYYYSLVVSHEEIFQRTAVFLLRKNRETGLNIAQVQPTAELTEQGCSKEDHPSIHRQLTKPYKMATFLSRSRSSFCAASRGFAFMS